MPIFFPDDPAYLEKIAFLCRKQLIEEIGEDQFYDDRRNCQSTEPRLENFDTFSFTDDTIEFFFQEARIFGCMEDMPLVVLQRKDLAAGHSIQ